MHQSPAGGPSFRLGQPSPGGSRLGTVDLRPLGAACHSDEPRSPCHSISALQELVSQSLQRAAPLTAISVTSLRPNPLPRTEELGTRGLVWPAVLTQGQGSRTLPCAFLKLVLLEVWARPSFGFS